MEKIKLRLWTEAEGKAAFTFWFAAFVELASNLENCSWCDVPSVWRLPREYDADVDGMPDTEAAYLAAQKQLWSLARQATAPDNLGAPHMDVARGVQHDAPNKSSFFMPLQAHIAAGSQ